MTDRDFLERIHKAWADWPMLNNEAQRLRDDLKIHLYPLSGLSWIERLATWMHEKGCHHNHTDGCSWEYEADWTGHAHKHWLEEAKTSPEGKALTALHDANPNDPILVDAGLAEEK